MFSPDDKQLASLGSDQVILWNPETGEKMQSVYGLYAMDYSPDGKSLTTDNVNVGMNFWDTQTGKMIKALPERYVFGVDYSPDGKTIAVAGEISSSNLEKVVGITYLVDIEKNEINEADLRDFLINPYTIAYSPDESLVAISDFAGNIYLWDPAGKKLIKQFTGIGLTPIKFFFTPDQRILFVASADGVLSVLEVEE